MDFEEERVGIHRAINTHAKRIITSYYSVLESCQIDPQKDSLLCSQVENFQIKLHVDSFLHSCRSLYAIASDLSINSLLHSPEAEIEERKKREAEVAKNIHHLRNESKLMDDVISSISNS
ncbi:conserved hypothetical protein [Theileria equi strain WA]|uniref:Mediator of RNA polymerase II transcription subunit 22 n=1 Tax=Theileria equi strain WA TaxID=1537102 RepID=L1LB90_THEEQ|nr:conserved hypothetical protein [Theileria equi strain WA]EKX72702.1 conserved hypothetical protein [Theileria equi strain WA]|eukprot:XP_004832154.1 conserved hypothetical protein [Theileria equi strain WA]